MNNYILIILIIIIGFMCLKKKEGFLAAPGIRSKLATKPSDHTENYNFDFNNLNKYDPSYWDLYHTTPDPPFETVKDKTDCGYDKYPPRRRQYFNDTEYLKFMGKRNIIKELVPANYSEYMNVSDSKFEGNYRITNPDRSRSSVSEAPQSWNYFWDEYKDDRQENNTEPGFENGWLRSPYKLGSSSTNTTNSGSG